MNAPRPVRDDRDPPSFDAYGAVTHEVINQPVELVDVNLYDSDVGLKEAVRREGAEWAANGLGAFGGRAGSAATLELGALANKNPPSSTPTTATGGGSTSSASIPPTTS